MEPKHLPKSSISAVTIILITAVLHFPASFSQQALPYDACERSECGDIPVDYPFWGPNRPVYCGHPGFQLTCQSDVLLFRSQSVLYRVLDIDSTTQTLTLARNDFWTNNCPQYLYNTTFDAAIFNGDNLGQEDISLYYRCGSSSGSTVRAPNQFSCTVNNTETESYSISTRLAGNLPNELVPCTDHVRVPVNQTWVDRWPLGTVMVGDLRSALTGGFRLQWTANDTECGRCVDSGGRCGSNSTFPALFACYCANGNFSLTCDNIDQSANEGSSSNGTLNIVLPIVGAIVAGIGIGWGIFVCRQRRRRRAIAASKTESKDIVTPVSSTEVATFTSSIPSYPSSRTMGLEKSTYFGTQVFTYEELELATNNFDDSRELGDGGFGTVYYGKLIDGREVAVKRLYENSFKRVEQFMNEVEILTKLHHENLVKLYGCTSKRSRELILVYEYIANGTVADHLHGKLANSNSGPLTWAVRLNIAIETAEALTYLHESDIIHRDVKTNNILLDKDFRVKVADFGLSRLFPNDATHVSTAPQGTPGYVDPEYYQCYQLTDKSDVYSFGVVLIELISALQAVDTNRHRHDINLASMAINKIQNHTLNELVDKSIEFETDGFVQRTITLVAELAFRCLQSDKDMRPTMKEVVKTLRGLGDEEFNVQKPEVLDIIVDDGAFLKGYNTNPSSPESGITDKLVGSSVPNSSGN